jgi:NAD(P)H-dependent flavin oxidoreductase YrpB (nitropropane dioxygenase family)
VVAAAGGFLHLPEGEDAQGVDPSRECYPAGQGVGAIDDLVPAAALVEQFVKEAEAALTRAELSRA